MNINDLIKESIKINTKTKGSCVSCEHRVYEEWQEYCTLTDRGEKCKYKQDSSELIRSVKENIEEEFKEECKKMISEYIENNIDKECVKYIPGMIKIWIR